MKFNFFRFSLLLLVIVSLSSCLEDTVKEVPTDASFVSLTFAKNDSFPTLAKAKFTLEYMSDDTVIVNLDSLPYKTRINKVVPTFSFYSSSAQFLITEKDTIRLTGKDTVDFSKPLKIRNYAGDKVTYKDYWVKVNVHQVEPELYVWQKMNDGIDLHNGTNQKLIVLDDTLFYYLNNETEAYAYKSVSGQSWEPIPLVGLPVTGSINDMQMFKGSFFLTQGDDKIYSSSDRRNWVTTVNADYNFKSLLFVLRDTLRAVVQSKTDLTYRFATSVDGVNWIVRGKIPEGFPVRGFSSAVFSSRTGKPKVLLIGGASAEKKTLQTRWSSEDGMYWVDFSQPDLYDLKNREKSLDTLATGASVIAYDNKLIVFGLRSDSLKATTYCKVSIDEGLSWKKADSLTMLPKTYIPRSYQSVVVYKPKVYNQSDSPEEIKSSNRIFIVGGKNSVGEVPALWTGKLNRKNFLRQ